MRQHGLIGHQIPQKIELAEKEESEVEEEGRSSTPAVVVVYRRNSGCVHYDDLS